MYKKQGTRMVNIRVPEHLYIMLKRLCVDENITMTSVFVQYLGYLKNKTSRDRRLLNATVQKTDFKLMDDGDTE